MRWRFFISILFCLAAFSGVRAQEILPESELKPGMIATAKTVFQGDKIEDFNVEIIDILRNFYPHRDLIIVKLRGPRPEFTGPVAGMSGSPVYYHGKIIGALSYSMGNFLKEPLMGVTPIEEMLEIVDKEKVRPKELAAAPSRATMQRFLQVALGIEPPNWEVFLPEANSPETVNLHLKRLPLPLQMSGFTPHSFSLAQKFLKPLGFIPVMGGSAGHENDGNPLLPGAPVAAVLLHGDMNIDATGTVTYRNGDQILAFGHPFFNNGPIELPMAQSHIITTISSQMASQKLGLTGKIVGTLRQDRTTGIMGVVGPVPSMTQINMSYVSETGQSMKFSFSAAQEKSLASFTPLILRIALISALESARLSVGQNSLALKGSIELEDGTKIKLDDLFPGYQPLPVFSFLNSILHSTGQIASTLAAITNNPFRYVKIRKVDLAFRSITGRQSADLESIWVNQAQFSPGDTIEVSYRLRPYQGKARTGMRKLVIPKSVQGRLLSIVVGGGPSVSAYERRLMPSKYRAESYASLIRLLRNKRRNDRLFIQIRLADRGLIVNGDELPGLPPSILPVFADPSSKNSTQFTRDRVIQQIVIPQKQMIQGVRVVRLFRRK